MKKVLLVSFIFISSILFSEAHVLIIGSGSFDDKAIIPLPGAVKDARAFKKTVISLSIAEEENIIYLENPTYGKLKRAILSWARLAKSQDDELIFYYSGHGYSKGGETYIIPKDVDPQFIEDTAVNLTDLLQRLKNTIKTDKVIVIIDACYSGSLIKDRPLRFKRYEKTSFETLSSEYAFLLSSKGDQTSQERPEGGGWFTYYLIKGMQGEANENADEKITLKELYDYLREKIGDVTNEKQTPILVASADLTDLVISADFSVVELKALKKLKAMNAPKNVIEIVSKIVAQNPSNDNEIESEIRNYIRKYGLGKMEYDVFVKLVKTEMNIAPQITAPKTISPKKNVTVPVKKGRSFWGVGVEMGYSIPKNSLSMDIHVRIGSIKLGAFGAFFPPYFYIGYVFSPSLEFEIDAGLPSMILSPSEFSGYFFSGSVSYRFTNLSMAGYSIPDLGLMIRASYGVTYYIPKNEPYDNLFSISFQTYIEGDQPYWILALALAFSSMIF